MRPGPLIACAVLVVFLVVRRRRLPRAVLIAGALAAIALAAYGAGLIPKPDVEGLLMDIGKTLGQWTYLLVGGLAFLETGAFIGLVAPGESAVIAGGVVAGQGIIQLVPLLLLVWACCVAGDSASYWLGRRLGRDFLIRHGAGLKITEQRVTQVEGYFDRRGGVTILVGRFVGLVRALAPFVAGASRMPYGRFLPYDVVGCGLWAAAFTLLGYVFWRNLDRATEIASRGTLAFGALVAVVVLAVVAFRRVRHNAMRR